MALNGIAQAWISSVMQIYSRPAADPRGQATPLARFSFRSTLRSTSSSQSKEEVEQHTGVAQTQWTLSGEE
eukprot:5983123-Amphidinium_carterae.1